MISINFIRKEYQDFFHVFIFKSLSFSKAAIPYMIKQGRGKIINVTSGLGEIVMPLFGAYSVDGHR